MMSVGTAKGRRWDLGLAAAGALSLLVAGLLFSAAEPAAEPAGAPRAESAAPGAARATPTRTPLATPGSETASPAVSVRALPPDLRTRHSGEDWPTFLGKEQDARSSESGLRWPAEGPPILWHRAIGEGYSMATTSRGRLFHFDRWGDRARLVALNAETGEELWRSEYPSVYVDAFEYSGGPRASPVVDGDRVYAFGVDGRLRCHRVTGGEVLWERDTAAEYGVVTNFFGVASTPLVVGDLLIVPIGGSPEGGDYDIHEGRVIPNGSGIVAFDKLTGVERYRAFDELASYSSPVLSTFEGAQRVVWFARDGLLIFDPRDGELVSRFPWKAKKVYSVNAANPVTVGSEIFLSESYEKGGVLLRYRGGKLETVWQDPPRRRQSMANHWNTAVYHDGHLYGSSGEKSGSAELRSVVWSTGEVRWRRRGLRRATLLYVDSHLVVLGEYGDLRLIEATPEEYREVGTAALEAEVAGKRRPLLRFPAWNPPILSHGILYVRGTDRLVALELIPAEP